MKGKIYLTIDDGPTEITGEMLEYLSRRKIGAVMFYVGKNMEKHWQLTLGTIKRGFVVGNHTHSHLSLLHSSHEKMVREIQRCGLMIEEAYDYVNHRRLKAFRFPYAVERGVAARRLEPLSKYLSQRGYVTGPYSKEGMWQFDVNFKDGANFPSMPNLENHFKKPIQTMSDGRVAVLHDYPANWRMGFFQAAIQCVKEQGFEFATNEEIKSLFTPP